MSLNTRSNDWTPSNTNTNRRWDCYTTRSKKQKRKGIR